SGSPTNYDRNRRAILASVPKLDATCLRLSRATVYARIERISTTQNRPQSHRFGTLHAAPSVTGTYKRVPERRLVPYQSPEQSPERKSEPLSPAAANDESHLVTPSR